MAETQREEVQALRKFRAEIWKIIRSTVPGTQRAESARFMAALMADNPKRLARLAEVERQRQAGDDSTAFSAAEMAAKFRARRM